MAEAAVDAPGAIDDHEAEHPYVRLVRGRSFNPPEAGQHDEEADEDDSHLSLQDGSGASPERAQAAQDPVPNSVPEASPSSNETFEDHGSLTGSLGSWPGDVNSANRPVVRARVMPDDFTDPRHCNADGSLKARRPMPQIKVRELLAGLTQLPDGRWIFAGPLNGWPAYTHLELRSLTCRADRLGFKQVRRFWTAGEQAKLPELGQIPRRTQATFLQPSWASVGWALDSPGFVWWFADRGADGPRVLRGESMLAALRSDANAWASATMVHSIAHRYPVEKETLRDSQTWHAAILVEWSHGLHTTLVELAWKDGCGGYGGKSNWCEDKLESATQIYQAMPESMKGPWNMKMSEIRMIDHPARNREEFEGYLQKYSDKRLPLCQQRFLEPQVYASGKVRLRSCTPTELAGFMLNYIHRLSVYKTFQSNCQTFAADLFAFLAGAKDHKPFGAIVRPGYQQRARSFLYVPHGSE